MTTAQVKQLVGELKNAGLEVAAKKGTRTTAKLSYDAYAINIDGCPMASDLLSFATSQKSYLSQLAATRSGGEKKEKAQIDMEEL
jgi:hypothetical protein